MSAVSADDALSLVVVSHGHEALIARLLPTLFTALPSSLTCDALLIDNVAPWRAAAWVEEHLPAVRVLRNPRPQSFAANVNSALALARGRYFVVSNPDIEYLPNLFEPLIRHLDEHPSAGIVGPRLLNADGSRQHSCRRFSTPSVTVLRALRLDRAFPVLPPIRRYLMSDISETMPADVDWITGALMMVRREAVAAVGGMDERYVGAYSEDQDWCCRMWRGGWHVRWQPEACARHGYQRAGVRQPFSRVGYLQLTNAIRMFRKFGWRLSRA